MEQNLENLQQNIPNMEDAAAPISAPGGISSSMLKIIAIIGMTLDHIGIIFGAHLPLGVTAALYAFGGLTFPIMAYLMGEGYRHTRNFKRYALRLLLFAIITQAPYWFFLMRAGNVLFTLLLGLMVLYLNDHMKSRVGFWFAFAGITAATIVLDWPLVGVPMVLLYSKLREKNKWQRLILPLILPYCLMVIPSLPILLMGNNAVLPSIVFVIVGCTLTVPLLARYEGRRGKPMKYFFYAYYPVHITVLGILYGLMFGWG